VPIMSDEPYSAERCEAVGVGRSVGPAERAAGSIRDAVRSLLADASYRTRAAELQAEMLALPSQARIAELLTSLALDRVPT
jgi:UDP:flavonoid glycosyltransferase YjiC (YdhE family)